MSKVGGQSTQVIRLEDWCKLTGDELAERLSPAVRALRRGCLVAFPTETVYGLGADALNEEAVRRIFAAKGRPADNPLIVHIAEPADLARLARRVPPIAWRLADEFWPGPLTMVVEASDLVPAVTTGGLDSVAVRMPNHEVGLALIKEARCPVAAPSANVSGRPSPTLPQHVLDDLGGKIDVLVAAGPCGVGVESTVVDIRSNPLVLLRPGGLPLEVLDRVVGQAGLRLVAASPGEADQQRPRSPGMKYRHYSPRASLRLFEGPLEDLPAAIKQEARRLVDQGREVAILATDETVDLYEGYATYSLGPRDDLSEVATRLFGLLREMDERGYEIVLVEGVPERGLGAAVMNRLRKAAADHVVRVARDGSSAHNG